MGDETMIKGRTEVKTISEYWNHFQPSKDTANQFNNAKIKFGFPLEKRENIKKFLQQSG